MNQHSFVGTSPFSKQRLSVVGVLFVHFLLFALISIVNHYNFRTYALDLGMFNKAIYDFSHFQNNVFQLGIYGDVNYFADHFSPLIVLLSPLQYVLGTATLLWIQIVAVLLGALGVYKYSKFRLQDHNVSLLVMIGLLSLWGVYSALAYDFHMNVLGAMMVPWFVLTLEKRQWKQVFLLWLLMVVTKENMAFWTFFIVIGVGMTDKGRYFKSNPKVYLALAGMSLVYFVLVIAIWMPGLGANEQQSQLARYGALGGSLSEMAFYSISHPIETIKLFFINHLGDSLYDGIKVEMYLVIACSGGLFMFFYPRLLVMLIPLFAQKFFSNNPEMWGIFRHYSIEFVPLISLGVIYSLQKIKIRKWRLFFAGGSVLAALTITVLVAVKSPKSWGKKNETYHLLDRKHFSGEGDEAELKACIDIIPDSASVAAHSILVPHLAFRDRIYQFPDVREAEYVVVPLKRKEYYPLVKCEYLSTLDYLRLGGDYELILENSAGIVVKKRSPFIGLKKSSNGMKFRTGEWYCNYDDSVSYAVTGFGGLEPQNFDEPNRYQTLTKESPFSTSFIVYPSVSDSLQNYWFDFSGSIKLPSSDFTKIFAIMEITDGNGEMLYRRFQDLLKNPKAEEWQPFERRFKVDFPLEAPSKITVFIQNQENEIAQLDNLKWAITKK